MSIFKIMDHKYRNMQDLENLVNYAIKPEHCIEGTYGAQGVLKGNTEEMYLQMYEIKNYFNKKKGRQAMHFILSFSEQEEKFIGLREALEIGYAVAGYFAGWQIVFGVHTNGEHLHIHFVLNTVSYVNGLKFSIGIAEVQKIQKWIEKMIDGYSNRRQLFSKCQTVEEMIEAMYSPAPFPCKIETN